MCSWLKESNRPYHILIGIIAALFGTIIGAAEVACALEGKDCQHDKDNAGKKPWDWSFKCWDWLDWLATMIGGAIGQAGQALVIYLIYTNPF